MPDLNGHYLICPHCKKMITADEEYEFRDVHEDFNGRDVITITCVACGKDGESFAFLKMVP